MAIKNLPSRTLLHQLLRYDTETGNLIWLARPRDLFKSNRQFLNWNNRYPGTIAGYARPTMKGMAYLHIGIQGAIFKAHRLVWVHVRGEPVPDIVDHIDHDPLNNRIENLRAATMSQNRANSFGRKNNLSGVKGVYATPLGTFMAKTRHKGQDVYLGTFATKDEAAAAYEAAAVRVFGEFARVHHR
jgi:hypothetical protein